MNTAALQKRAYKEGFLRGLAEQGVTPPEFFSQTKQAFLDTAVDLGTSAVGAGADSVVTLAKILAGAGIGIPVAAGALSGAAAAKMNSKNVEDIQMLRDAETTGRLRRLTREAIARMQRNHDMN